ncbi:MAG TPA: hypothetical protein VJV79_22805 [Polyangiaceae bacterium]|nr:hypothetical protein [Polyangiaceae bacterium]
MSERLPEKHESLWLLAAPLLVWAGHFLLSYVTAAVWCAKLGARFGGLGPARSALFVYTGLALLGIAWLGVIGYKHHRRAEKTTSHAEDTPEDRHAFIGLATVLLAGLSAIAVVYSGLPALLIGSCR